MKNIDHIDLILSGINAHLMIHVCDRYGWQPCVFTLVFIWLVLNNQRPPCSTRPRPRIFIDQKSFLLFIVLVSATTICPHVSVSESYPACLIWMFSPWQIVPLDKPERGDHNKATSTDTARQSTEVLIGWRVSHWRTLVTDYLAVTMGHN